jgi:DNA ligase (NAD+)
MEKSELISHLKQANKAYLANLPIMTDSEYDQLWRELYSVDPNNSVLYHTANDPNIPGDLQVHSRPIYGTNKAFCVEDLKPFLTRHRGKSLVIEPKYDGCAAVLERTKYGYRLTLEGNGQYGQDVTRHLFSMFMGFEPQVFESVELIIPQPLWNPDWGKNPRNVVAGWLARKELPYESTVEIVSHNQGNLRVTVPADRVADPLIMNKNNFLFDMLLELYTEWRELYPIDGLMIKVADPKERLVINNNGTTYGWSIAWKPPIQTKWTQVEHIEWNVSRSGRVIPTVIYQPIDLCGTTNSRVTGNNAAWIEEQQIYKGSKILVGKAGEIIPKILQVDNSDLHNNLCTIPDSCPFCGGFLSTVGRDRICNSDSCLPQQISRIAYFYSDKGMDLKGIGEAMIAEMLDDPILKHGFTDRVWLLLDPHDAEAGALFRVLGEKRYKTYTQQRDSISGKKTPVHFITGLGYKGLAYKTVLALWTYMQTGKLKGSHSPEKLHNFTLAMTEYYRALQDLNRFKLNLQVVQPTVTYCITGTMSSSRQDMIDYLSTKNWLFSNQVSKHVDVLIVGDKPGKTKTTKAKELNVPMITEAELPAVIQANEKGE